MKLFMWLDIEGSELSIELIVFEIYSDFVIKLFLIIYKLKPKNMMVRNSIVPNSFLKILKELKKVNLNVIENLNNLVTLARNSLKWILTLFGGEEIKLVILSERESICL